MNDPANALMQWTMGTSLPSPFDFYGLVLTFFDFVRPQKRLVNEKYVVGSHSE